MIAAKDFSEKWGVSVGNIHVQRHNGHKFVHKIGGRIYVDEESLVKRQQFRKKVWIESTENYEFLVENNGLPSLYCGLAKYYGTTPEYWQVFLSSSLFNIAQFDMSILVYITNKRMCMFWKYSKREVRKLKKRNSL